MAGFFNKGGTEWLSQRQIYVYSSGVNSRIDTVRLKRLKGTKALFPEAIREISLSSII
jgi:hypothetical protein